MKTSPDPKEEATEDALGELSEEAQCELIAHSLDQFCYTLESQGINPQILAQTLFLAFAERMCELGDCEAYEALLEEALEDQWDEHYIH